MFTSTPCIHQIYVQMFTSTLYTQSITMTMLILYYSDTFNYLHSFKYYILIWLNLKNRRTMSSWQSLPGDFIFSSDFYLHMTACMHMCTCMYVCVSVCWLITYMNLLCILQINNIVVIPASYDHNNRCDYFHASHPYQYTFSVFYLN